MDVVVRQLGVCDYTPVWEAMREFTATRTPSTPDEIWLLEHAPVYTLGLNARVAPGVLPPVPYRDVPMSRVAGRRERPTLARPCASREQVPAPRDIPVIHTDRGGQVTYHGPGQVVAYVLLDLRRRALGVRQLVSALEQSVIEVLADYAIGAHARRDAPGVYVDGAKIAALGLRVRQGRCYHGLSLNVAMDVEPYSRIHPCGYPDLQVTDMRALGVAAETLQVADRLIAQLAQHLGYTVHPAANETSFTPSALPVTYNVLSEHGR
ncbi:MAG: lipoyl(octanoyl) transferase LipB [Gammaproteobacteria bacterium]|nr:lipoyl(octanoyl) transferase LipB [Gammaproteobacteria bacterium]